jgi:hypothetical protein
MDFSADESHLAHWDNRKSFSIQDFAKKYNFGRKSVAANFYTAQWDEEAQIIRDRMGLP